MGIFQQFPYSNFHEMNLDQIIKIMRELQDEWNATKTDWASYKDFIDNYFENLNVTQEISDKINSMIADGSFNRIVDPVIVTETANWLAEHITITEGTTVIDDTLSIQGAAADAKATGDAIKDVNSDVGLINFPLTGTWTNGKYVNATNGAISDNAQCGYIDKMDISEYAGTDIIIRYYNYHPAGFAFYDAGNHYISGSSADSYIGIYQLVRERVTVPENAKYIAMTTTYQYESHRDEYYILCYKGSPLYSKPEVSEIENDIADIKGVDGFTKLDLTSYTLTEGKFVDGRNGMLTDNTICSVIQNIDVSRLSKLYIGYYLYVYAGFAFYDFEGAYITGSIDRGLNTVYAEAVSVPENAKYLTITVRRYDYPDLEKFFVLGFQKMEEKPIYSLQDAYAAWLNGKKFPIAFYGDSTTDGWRTTNWVANTLGSDHTTGYLYTDVLQALLRTECENNILRVYNAGFTGQSLAWALSHFEEEFINTGVAYSDVKMIGISFGINDAIQNEAQYKTFKSNLIKLCKKCYSYGIQPFLVTTQATYENAVRNETYANHSYANQAKKEVAKELCLELIDTEKYTSRFIAWSKERLLNIIPDTCHFADVGHKFEGGMYFWQIVPRTIYIAEDMTAITPYTIGITSAITWGDGNYGMLYANNEGSNRYKTQIYYTRDNPTDIAIIDAWVYLDRPMNLTPYFGTLNTQYLIIDGTSYTPSADNAIVANLDMGLHHIKVMSGLATTLCLYGLRFTI